MASRLEMDIESFAIDDPEATYVTDNLWPATVWAGVRDADNPNNDQKRGGTYSFYHSPGCRLTLWASGEGTGHVFDGAAEYGWYTFWHYVETIANAAVDDVLWVMAFEDVRPTGGSYFLAVTAKVTATAPITFRYALEAVHWDGDNWIRDTLCQSTTDVGVGGGQVLQVEVHWVSPNSTMKLFMDGTQEGSTSAAQSGNYLSNGAYMLTDTTLAAGKGSSNFEAYFDDLVANDDVGTGRTTMPDWETYVPEGQGDVLKLSTIAWASVKKVSSIAEASVSKASTIDAN